MKRRAISIVSFLHIILWGLFLLASVVLKLTYSDTGMEQLEFALSKGVYNVFIVVAIVGIINAATFFFSLRSVLWCPEGNNKTKRIIAFGFSALATITFYLSAVLIFLITSDRVIVVPIVWLILEICCIVFLFISKEKFQSKQFVKNPNR